MAQNFEARNSCQPGTASLWRFRRSFQLFRLHILSYNSPISRFCPSGDASYGEWASDLAKFSALLGFSPFFYVFPPIDEETLYARAPRVSARADGTNRPGARR